MTRWPVKILVSLLGIFLTITVFGIDVQLTYEKYVDHPTSHQPYGSVQLTKFFAPPEGKWKLPPLKSKVPVYAFAKFGSSERLTVLDRQNAEDAFYTRIYFDTNGNRDLTDDPVIDGTNSSKGPTRFYTNFPAIGTTVQVNGKNMPYCFQPSCSYYHRDTTEPITAETMDKYLRFYLKTFCCYRGEFELDGTTYSVSLSDRNINGTFDDTLTSPVSTPSGELFGDGDGFYITARGKTGPYDGQKLSNFLLLNGKLYGLEIDIADEKLRLNPFSDKMVNVTLPMEVEHLKFYNPDGKRSIIVYRSGKTIKIPGDTYRVYGYHVLRKDKKGSLWRLVARGTKDTPWATVDGKPGANLIFGEPYTPLVEVPKWSLENFEKGAGQVYLNFTIKGSGHEMVKELARVSGIKSDIPVSSRSSNRPKEPAYTIKKTDGTIVTQGSFEYG